MPSPEIALPAARPAPAAIVAALSLVAVRTSAGRSSSAANPKRAGKSDRGLVMADEASPCFVVSPVFVFSIYFCFFFFFVLMLFIRCLILWGLMSKIAGRSNRVSAPAAQAAWNRSARRHKRGFGNNSMTKHTRKN